MVKGVCVAKGGMHGERGACMAKGGACVVKGGVHGTRYSWSFARAVRILLECILVF